MEDQLIRGHEGLAAYTNGTISRHQSKRLVTEKRIKVIKPSGERGPVYFRASDVDAGRRTRDDRADSGGAGIRADGSG
jgi:hypothetical protein